MSARPEKILALQFKYLGDAVLLTPALRALREHYPSAELHLILPAELAPVLRPLPWLDRVWAMPRRRGEANAGQTWPLIRALRRERFDRLVDFGTNDRGAITSFLTGARQRLGWADPGGFFGRKYLYHRRVMSPGGIVHESARLVHLLTGWGVPAPGSLAAELRADPALAAAAEAILPEREAIVFHLASSQPRKEWPVERWAELHAILRARGNLVVFTTAQGAREGALTERLKALVPEARVLPLIPDLSLFVAVLARARALVSGDTGPLHLAAGLGVSTVSLYGPTHPARWGPVGRQHRHLTGTACGCDGHAAECSAPRHCLAAITPGQVVAALDELIGEEGNR